MEREIRILCNIFPEEIWEMILKRLSSTSRDIHNVNNALPDLLQIDRFQVQKPIWLFPEVLPLLSEYLGLQGVLSCRLVCKQWDQTLHNCVSNHPCHQPYNEDPQIGLPINTVEINQNCPMFKLATSNPVLHFCTADSMEHFLEISKNTQFLRDPVFGNTIYFDPKVDPNNTRRGFNQSSLATLTEFGDIIKHLILSSDKDFETPQQFYIRICNYLQLTPNLKSLSLQFENQDETRDLPIITRRNPLPRLPFLQSLHIKIGILVSGNRGNMMQTVMSFAGSDVFDYVRKLKLEFLDYISGVDMRSLVNPTWNNLNRCFLQKLTDLELRSNENMLRQERFKERNLQKLVIHARAHSDLFLDGRVLADCMNGNYGENLRVLNLRNCGSDRTTMSELSSARLNKLHTLQIRNFHQLNFQFLLKLPALLKLEVSGSPEKFSVASRQARFQCLNDRSTVGVLIYNGIYNRADIANSNIWQLLPKLQKLKIIQQQGEKFILTSFSRPRAQ